MPREELQPVIANISGLGDKEAARRLEEEGANEIPSIQSRTVFAIAFEVIRQPMFLLLAGGGIIYFLLGDVHEALMLLGFVCVVMGITFYQERKTERALEALRDLSSPRALVIRSGERKRIAGRDVVRDDVLVLAEGDRVPADAHLLSCTNLAVDESLLTGESVPVRKVAWDGIEKWGRPGGDDLPFVYSGTMVVQGQGIARVQATGLNTEIGKIGKALQTVEPEETLLQRETGRWVRNLAIIGVSLSAMVVVIYGLTRDHWLEGLLSGIALAMAMLPEEFPVVLTIFLALGAWRIAQKQVLTRRTPAVEALGSATVLCVDKTGTLTLNQMSVQKIFADGECYDIARHVHEPLPEIFHELVEFSILGCQKHPFDPMEKALLQLGERMLRDTEHLHDDWILERGYPLSRDLLALSHVWRSPSGEELVISAKGAPEAIFDLCHLNEGETREFGEQVRLMAEEGLRVLGVARASFKKPILPDEQHDFEFEFLGLVGFEDPVRPTVPDAIRECYTAGIRVVMITGDYPGTAQNIARRIGLAASDACISGLELDRMDNGELQERIKSVNVFARVVPEQKLRLVNALKANGEIVAMTGDGVNDAPALKAAHIGIAMGQRGTDVAREASALVLLDDDFSSIEQAVKLGRRIFDNLRKAMAYIFAIHVPIAGMSLLPVLFQWPLALFPVHIAFLELIIDPACSIAFEAESEEPDVMKRLPRKPTESLFGTKTVILSVLQGVIVLLIVLVVFRVSLGHTRDEFAARALAFTTLIVANVGLIFTNRSWSRTTMATLSSPNAALWWIVVGAYLFLGLVLYIPSLRQMFHFATPHPIDLAVSLAAGVFSILWFEIVKILNGKRQKSA